MRISIFTFCLLFLTLSYSQDIITKNNGENIQARVMDITSTAVEYKKLDNLDGPIDTVSRKDIVIIQYEDGFVDFFDEDRYTEEVYTDSTSSAGNSAETLVFRGRQDASLYYYGDKSGYRWTAVTCVITSPIVGLIPAILSSSTKPKQKNLNFPAHKLIQEREYKLAYEDEAHSIKKKKIWKNYFVGTGIWVVLIIIIGSLVE